MKHHTGTSILGNAFRRTLTWYLMIAGILALLIGSTLGAVAVTRAAPAPQPYITLSQSVPQQIATYKLLGHHNSNAPLTIELALHPNNQAALDNLINALYDRKSPQFHTWLPTGAFAARFGLTSSQLAAVKGFLSQAGLHVAPGAPGAFLLRAVGTSGQVEAAFHTTINDYLALDGSRYFANATSIISLLW
jgi:subtilase family serine protease